MLRIFHVRGTRSVRPIWLCHELGLTFEIVPIDFAPTYRNSLEWRAISPAGKVPAMKDGDLTMFESGAMIDYILERYGEGRLRPAPGTAESALYRQWCWFSEATLARPLGAARLLSRSTEHREPVAVEAEQKARECLKVVDRAVSQSDFLLGEQFSAADVMMGYSLALLSNLKVFDEQYPKAQAYLDRLKLRNAFQRATSA